VRGDAVLDQGANRRRLPGDVRQAGDEVGQRRQRFRRQMLDQEFGFRMMSM
jgi:hypothetical protein